MKNVFTYREVLVVLEDLSHRVFLINTKYCLIRNAIV